MHRKSYRVRVGMNDRKSGNVDAQSLFKSVRKPSPRPPQPQRLQRMKQRRASCLAAMACHCKRCLGCHGTGPSFLVMLTTLKLQILDVSDPALFIPRNLESTTTVFIDDGKLEVSECRSQTVQPLVYLPSIHFQ